MRNNPTLQHERREAASESGFTLIELLIVVAIILIIAAIAIPNFMRSKIAANQAAAVSNVRTITTAAVIYSATWQNGYPPTLDSLGGNNPTATCDLANLVDPIISTPPYRKTGYIFSYSGEEGNVPSSPAGCGAPGFNGYLVNGVPSSPSTGTRSFCSYDPAVIHFDVNGQPAATQTACEALPAL
jgi:type IV pilus assembly protein PilA